MRTPARHGRTARMAVALLVPVLLLAAACSSSPPRSHRVTDGGSAAAHPAPDNGDDAAAKSSAGAATSPKGGRSPSSQPSSQPPIDYLARVPAFGPAPRAEPIHLPESTSAPFLSSIPTTQPVAFITIDDGWIKRPEALPLLKRAGVPVTLFLSLNAMQDNPAYFGELRSAGAVIEAHTLTHPNLRGRSYDFQKHEICASADQLGQLYGRRPVLFRPPFGNKDANTLRATRDCGMHAAFFWKETIDKGIVRYQVGASIQRGDIILMHFRDRFVDDFIAALVAIKAAGLTPALLEDYIP